MKKKKAVNASTSNAGDDFHLLWATRRCLELLRPNTELTAIKPEGINQSDANQVDESGNALLVADLTEYYGGQDFTTSHTVRILQLKYSTTSPNSLWTASAVSAGKKPKSTVGSLIHRLSSLFFSFREHYGRDAVLDKLQLCLVSNRPTSRDLCEALQAARTVLEDAKVKQKASLLKAIDAGHAELINQIAIASKLSSPDFVDFLRILDLTSKTDQLSRVWQEIEIADNLARSGFGETSTQRSVLKSRVWDLSQPGEDRVISKDEIVVLLHGGTYSGLFPAQPAIAPESKLVPREQSREIANRIAASSSGLFCLHGGGGFGKTTIVSSLFEHFPEGSKTVIFDCYAAGQYKNPEDQRNLPKYALRQICNELAVVTGTELLLQSSIDDSDLFRFTSRKLRLVSDIVRASNSMAIVCLIIDAADNSVDAALDREQSTFVHDLVRIQLPENCKIVLTCRTHRIDSLRLPDATVKIPLEPFSLRETAENLRQYFPDSPENEVLEFHKLSNMNPRVQAYSLLNRDHGLSSVLDSLRPGKTLDDLFKASIISAELKNGSTGLVDCVLESIANLPRPIPLSMLVEMTGGQISAVQDVCTDLIHGVYIADGKVNLRDEDLESFLNQRYPASNELARKRADLFLRVANDSEYAARNLGVALSKAGLFDQLLDAIKTKKYLDVLLDPLERRRIQRLRIRLALRNHSRTVTSTTIALLFALSKEAKATDATDSLLRSNLQLALRYGSPETIQHLLFPKEWAGFANDSKGHMSSAVLLSRLEGPSPRVREHQRMAEISLREWFKMDKDARQENSVGSEDFADLTESILRCEGYQAASDWLKSFQPREFRLEVCQKVVEQLFRGNQIEIAKWLQIVPPERDVLLAITSASLRSSHPCNPAWLSSLVRFLPSLCCERRGPIRVQLRPMIIDAAEVAVRDGRNIGQWKDMLKSYVPSSLKISADLASDEDMNAVDLLFRVCSLLSLFDKKGIGPEDPRLVLDNRIERPADYAKLQTDQQKRLDEKKDREQQSYKESLSVSTYILPSYLFRAKTISSQLERGAYLSELQVAIEAAAKALDHSSRHSYREGRIIRWKVHSAKVLCRTILLTSEDPSSDFTSVLELFREPWPELQIDFAQLASKDLRLHGKAIELLDIAHKEIESKPMSGSEKIRLLIRLCECATAIAPKIGQYYFERALEAAEEVDEEAFSIISFLSALSTKVRGSQPSIPLNQEAELLAKITEDFSLKLDGWEHFPWEDAISGIAELCPKAGAAFVCRMDQAGRYSISDSLLVILQTLARLNESPRRLNIAACLLPNNWRENGFKVSLDTLRRLYDDADPVSPAATKILKDYCLRSGESGQRRSLAQQLANFIEKRSTTDTLIPADLKEFLKFQESIEATDRKGKPSTFNYTGVQKTDTGGDFDEKKLIGDYTRTVEIDAALLSLQREHNEERPYVHFEKRRLLLSRIRGQVQIEAQVGHLDAILHVSSDLLPFQNWIEYLSNSLAEWKSNPLIRQWSSCLPERIAARAAEFLFSGDGLLTYALGDLPAHAKVEEDVFMWRILEALPSLEVCDDASPRALHEFMARLAARLEPSEAIMALRHVLEELSKKITARDTSSNGLASTKQKCDGLTVASGLFWYLLGHPDTRIRWKAIHGCRAIHELGVPVLEELSKWLHKGQYHPYCNDGKPFYWLAARQWYFLLLERLCQQDPVSCLGFRQLVRHELTDSPFPHAIVFTICKRILRILNRVDLPGSTKEDRQLLKKTLKYRIARYPKTNGWVNDLGSPWASSSDQFDFDQMDTVRYWYSPLAEVFQLKKEAFFPYIERIIRNEWCLPGSIRFLDCTDKMYPHESYIEFANGHGSPPTIERFRTHIELHAMFCAATRMLQDHPVHLHRYSDGDEDLWNSWISSWDLTTPPQWQSDQRLSTPLEPVYWKCPDEEFWKEAPDESTYEWILGLCDSIHKGFIQVWGGSDLYHRGNSRRFSVSSALVSPDSAAALMLAYQDSNPNDFRIPSEDDTEMEIEEDLGDQQVSLRGWIANPQISTSSLEESDPYRYRASSTLLSPGKDASKYFQIAFNTSTGEFRSKAFNKLVALRENWCDKPDQIRDEDNAYITEGNQLWFDRFSLLEFLVSTNRSLILEVSISRSLKEGKLSKPNFAYGDGKYDRNSRIFVIDKDGGVTSLRGYHSDGAKDL